MPIQWHAKTTGFYGYQSTEAVENATLIYSAFVKAGWTPEAACGAIGSFWVECGLNPWCWGFNNVPDYADRLDAFAYGLPMWVPAKKYLTDQYLPSYDPTSSPYFGPNYNDVPGKMVRGMPSDGRSQVDFIIKQFEAPTAGNFWNNLKPYTRAQYIAFTDIELANYIWTWQYENPGNNDQSAANRLTYSRYYYNLLKDTIPVTDPLDGYGQFPYWLLLAKKAQEQFTKI